MVKVTDKNIKKEYIMTDNTDIPVGAASDNVELWRKLNYMQKDITALRAHDTKCDEQHSFWKDRDEQHRRNQEKNNEALISLSNSLSAMNDTVKKILPIIERTTKEYTIRDWVRKEGIPYLVLLLGLVLTLKHLLGG